MLRYPDEGEIVEYGDALGLHLSTTEARLMQSRMAEVLASLESFWAMQVEEQRLPSSYHTRDPGYRPSPQEDPLNLFIRKCHIQGASQGPLQGKTIGLKDHISVAGMPLTFGSHFMEGYIPDFDATLVTRVLDAGGTIVGKLVTDGFSTTGPGVGAPGDFGRPCNPHNPTHLTGGSSSGSAAAVAACAVDIAFGGDQGGSIRQPAAWCGVLGLKATLGLIPHTGIFGYEPTIDYVGPLTRTVEDMATVLRCVAGADGYDPRQAHLPAQLPDYTEALEKDVAGLRIGILEEGFGLEESEPEVETAVLDAVATLESAGARVEKVSAPLHQKANLAQLPLVLEGLKRMFDTNLGGAFSRTYYPSSLMAAFGRFKQSSAHQLPVTTKMNLILGSYLERFYNGVFYAKAYNVRPTFIKQYEELFAGVDFLAMPTTPITAPAYHEPADIEDATRRALWGIRALTGSIAGGPIAGMGMNTQPFNFTGYPAISIPCGKVEGLPVGLQLVAPYFREDLLLRAAYAYQCSVDWASLLSTT